eukprot:XP_014768843.1 PREDICTED: uncharacterized protein LOC106868193 [Octopus bimaculoides]
MANIIQNWYKEHKSDVRYGKWYTPPRTVQEAERNHYQRKNSVCRTKYYHGFLWQRPDDLLSQPIYDNNGLIVGLQSAIKGRLEGFDSNNNTIRIPSPKTMPPFMVGETIKKDVKLYTLTAYFKHPRLICNPGAQDAKEYKGLYIQMGNDPEKEYMEIPLKLEKLSKEWKKAECVAKMGTHYFMNLSKKLNCEELYPVFLTYTDGKLGAFGWMFQGKPPKNNKFGLDWYYLPPNLYAFTGLQKDYLPACMLNKNFQINGIHIWLRPPSEQLCKKRPIHTPQPCSKTTTTIVQIKIYPHTYYTGTANPPRAPSLTLIFILIISIGLL